MSKSGIRRKHDEDTTQLRRRSHPTAHTYKEGPPGRANGGAAEDARKDTVEDPPISLLEEDKDKTWLGGVGRPHRSAEPDQHLVRCISRRVTANAPDHLSHLHLVGTDLQQYK